MLGDQLFNDVDGIPNNSDNMKMIMIWNKSILIAIMMIKMLIKSIATVIIIIRMKRIFELILIDVLLNDNNFCK